jgi:two-component system, cell cycle response regulator CpdR
MTVRILYVEDNDDLRDSVAMLLDAEGRRIVTCSNAGDALAEMARAEFDLLITDISLPGMSGMELTRQVLASHPEQWVVLCSGYEFADRLGTLGPNVRALTKPFEIEALDALLAEVTSALRSAQQQRTP